MLRPTLWLILLGTLVACRPCEERCFAGWRVSLESEGPLDDGRYDVVLTPDAGPALEASCVITDQGSTATCEGILRARGITDRYDALLLEDVSRAVERGNVKVFKDDELWNEAQFELEKQPTESCNPHCAWDSASIAL